VALLAARDGLRADSVSENEDEQLEFFPADFGEREPDQIIDLDFVERPFWIPGVITVVHQDEVEDISLDYADFHHSGLEMKKWTRLFLKKNARGGDGLLSIKRLRPDVRGDSDYLVVGRDNKVVVQDIRDSRIKMAPGRLNYGAPIGLTTAQMTSAEKTADRLVGKAKEQPKPGERVLIAASGRKGKASQQHTVVDLMEWVSSTAVVLFTKYQFGTVCASLMFGWRAWTFLNLTEKVVWGYNKIRGIVESVEDANEAYELIRLEYDAGNLDFLFHIFYLILGFYLLIRVVWPLLGYLRVQIVYLVSPAGSPSGTPPATPDGGEIHYGFSAEHSDEDTDVEDAQYRSLVEQNQKLVLNMDKLMKKMGDLESAQSKSAGSAELPSVGSGGLVATPSGGGDPLASSAVHGLDSLFDKLLEHEKVVDQDGLAKKEKKKALKVEKVKKKKKKSDEDEDENDSDSEDEADVSSGDGSDFELKSDMARLEDEAKNPRTEMLKKLRSLKKRVTWRLAGGRRARVAPRYLARLYSGASTAVEKIRKWIAKKDLKGCAAAEALLQLAYLLDRMVKERNHEMVNLESVEVICRRMYGTQLSYKNVRDRADWERPKNLPNGHKWASKVTPELLAEYDVLKEDEEDVPAITPADREVRGRLKQRALLSKHLGMLGSAAADLP